MQNSDRNQNTFRDRSEGLSKLAKIIFSFGPAIIGGAFAMAGLMCNSDCCPNEFTRAVAHLVKEHSIAMVVGGIFGTYFGTAIYGICGGYDDSGSSSGDPEDYDDSGRQDYLRGIRVP